MPKMLDQTLTVEVDAAAFDLSREYVETLDRSVQALNASITGALAQVHLLNAACAELQQRLNELRGMSDATLKA